MGIFDIVNERYRQKKFDTIVEGCQLYEIGEEPQYCGLELLIPMNACCLVVPGFKFLLYARDFDISKKAEIPRNI